MFEAISQMKNNKAPGPDGFPAEFYKKCWGIIKGDLMPMFHDLFNGHLQLCKLKLWYHHVVIEEGGRNSY